MLSRSEGNITPGRRRPRRHTGSPARRVRAQSAPRQPHTEDGGARQRCGQWGTQVNDSWGKAAGWSGGGASRGGGAVRQTRATGLTQTQIGTTVRQSRRRWRYNQRTENQGGAATACGINLADEREDRQRAPEEGVTAGARGGANNDAQRNRLSSTIRRGGAGSASTGGGTRFLVPPPGSASIAGRSLTWARVGGTGGAKASAFNEDGKRRAACGVLSEVPAGGGGEPQQAPYKIKISGSLRPRELLPLTSADHISTSVVCKHDNTVVIGPPCTAHGCN